MNERIRSDKIDILIDLGGHTFNSQINVMALCPAPIQVTWIGYPNTTGLDCVHYRITDAVCDPVNRCEIGRITAVLCALLTCDCVSLGPLKY